MNNNKSPGEDLIPGEMLKTSVRGIEAEKLHYVLNLIWQAEVFPEVRKRGTTFKILKKKNLADRGN